MITLDYGTLLSATPILLSIGTIKNPTLKEIATLTFEKFGLYEGLLKMTPELIYTKFKDEEGIKYWESLNDAQKSEIELYDLIISDKNLIETYTNLFNFFFYERVIFFNDVFILLNKDILPEEEITEQHIKGVINKFSFNDVLNILQQICCMNNEKTEQMKFKNKLAQKLYEKMNRKDTKPKEDEKFSLPNIISAVSNYHPTISPITVWEMTLFQLYDSFNRLQINEIYQINRRKVSVWGDEKNSFDITMWYKNIIKK